MKYMHQKGDPVRDSRVSPLEALWWTEGVFDMSQPPDTWLWTAMIMQPGVITRKVVDAAIEELRRKNNPPALPKLRFESFAEGLSVQILHLGPYAEERPTIERMHRFARDNGYAPCGKHHEIYLGDPRRTKPEKLKTVVRQPVEKAG
jgi:hypothetical protein